MHAIDWICLTIVGASFLLGAWRGLLYEALSVTAWVAAYLAARWAGPVVGKSLPMGDSSLELRVAAGVVLVFIGVAFAGGMLAWGARGAARALGMRPVDRVFGAAFGALRGALLLLLLAAVAHVTNLRDAPWWRESFSGPWLHWGLLQLQPLLPPVVGQYLSA